MNCEWYCAPCCALVYVIGVVAEGIGAPAPRQALKSNAGGAAVNVHKARLFKRIASNLLKPLNFKA